jgi:hypothetical protein
MDRHEVIGFSPRSWEFPFQELIEGSQIVQPPVLPCSDFTKVAAQFHEPDVPFLFRAPLPSQDFVDLRQYNRSPSSIEFGCQEIDSLVVKMFKPIKIAGSRPTNEFGINKLLIAQT